MNKNYSNISDNYYEPVGDELEGACEHTDKGYFDDTPIYYHE